MGWKTNTHDKAEKLLPDTITGIHPQKKNRNRYTIYVNEQYLLGVSEKVLLNFSLEKGKTLTVQEYRDIRAAENRQYARNYLLKLLGQRDHARGELLRKARQKQLNTTVVEQILDEFEKQGWIDSESFARSFISDKFRLNNWGPRKIVSSLRQKGIQSSQAEKLTDEFFNSVDLYQTFNQLIQKNKYKWEKEAGSAKKRKKVFDYLTRKGYHTQQILKHLDRLMEHLER